MSENVQNEVRAAMTQVIGSPGGKGEEILGEIESSGVSVGWNRATLTPGAHSALQAILERAGVGADRPFDLRHGVLRLLRCRMLPGNERHQLSFDGSQRRA